MAQTTKYQPGMFCWVELGTTDATDAKKFYSAVLGWEYKDDPIPMGGVYTLVKLQGKDAGGLYSLSDEQRKMGVPSHWLSYVSVTNADDTTRKAQTLGAKVLMGPMDVMDHGRMSVLQDPVGAAFAIWQPKQHSGVHPFQGEHGSSCWNELATTDVDRAGKFYTLLFGWKTKASDAGGMKYIELMVGDQAIGGLYQPDPQQKITSGWMVYFAVSNCDESVKKAKNAGALICVPPTDIPSVGRFSILVDPQKAAFALIKLTH